MGSHTKIMPSDFELAVAARFPQQVDEFRKAYAYFLTLKEILGDEADAFAMAYEQIRGKLVKRLGEETVKNRIFDSMKSFEQRRQTDEPLRPQHARSTVPQRSQGAGKQSARLSR